MNDVHRAGANRLRNKKNNIEYAASLATWKWEIWWMWKVALQHCGKYGFMHRMIKSAVGKNVYQYLMCMERFIEFAMVPSG